MNLNAIAAPLVSAVQPQTPAKWKASTGYTTASDGKRVPTYAAPVSLNIAVQPLSSLDLKQLDAMNIQGVQRTVFINAAAEGINRPAAKGGDLLSFAGRTWLVSAVIEAWGPWSKLGVTAQLEAAF